MSQNPKLVQHKRGPSSVLLKLLDHVSLVSINTPGTTTSFSFKCSNPEFAGFGLCQWFAFTSDPSSPTNSNQCDVPSSESSRKCWVFCTTCFYQIMQMIFLIFTFCRFLCNFWGRGRFGRRLKNFALHGECDQPSWSCWISSFMRANGQGKNTEPKCLNPKMPNAKCMSIYLLYKSINVTKSKI